MAKADEARIGSRGDVAQEVSKGLNELGPVLCSLS